MTSEHRGAVRGANEGDKYTVICLCMDLLREFKGANLLCWYSEKQKFENDKYVQNILKLKLTRLWESFIYQAIRTQIILFFSPSLLLCFKIGLIKKHSV